MGQPITVTMRAGIAPRGAVLRGEPVDHRHGDRDVHSRRGRRGGARPPDVLARRLFDLGATKVTVYSNVVTVEAPASAWPDLEAKVTFTIEHLFEFYGDDAGWSFAARAWKLRFPRSSSSPVDVSRRSQVPRLRWMSGARRRWSIRVRSRASCSSRSWCVVAPAVIRVGDVLAVPAVALMVLAAIRGRDRRADVLARDRRRAGRLAVVPPAAHA